MIGDEEGSLVKRVKKEEPCVREETDFSDLIINEEEVLLKSIFDEDHVKSLPAKVAKISLKCELCDFVGEDVDQKRAHQCIKHFTKELAAMIKLGATSPRCPKCEYKHRDAEDLIKHVGTDHKEVDKFIAKTNPLKIYFEKQFPAEDAETDSEDEEEFTLADCIEHWKDESGVKSGICHSFDTGRSEWAEPGLGGLAPRNVLTKQESAGVAGKTEPQPDHSWLCDGRLLQLHQAVSPHNTKLFQHQWARGQPVLISNSHEAMNKRLWHPRAFAKDFGRMRSDLVNTLTGKIVPNQPLKWFWEGFENVSLRLLDECGTPMLLKLKDWPPDGDIKMFMPKRFHDLVHDFPIRDYTLREGRLNLASYIPEYFLRPELGPKMYIAYGNALYSNKGSTNLHLDMSDAVNLMVWVGVPADTDRRENRRLELEQVDEAGCDLIMKRRLRERDQVFFNSISTFCQFLLLSVV